MLVLLLFKPKIWILTKNVEAVSDRFYILFVFTPAGHSDVVKDQSSQNVISNKGFVSV